MTLPSTRSKIGRASEVCEAIAHLPSASFSSSRSMRPICEPQKPAITAGLPLSVPAVDVGARDALEVLGVGEDEVLVAGEDDVDAVDGGELQRGVLGAGLGRVGADAGVGERDDDVGAFLLHLRARRPWRSRRCRGC